MYFIRLLGNENCTPIIHKNRNIIELIKIIHEFRNKIVIR